MCHTQIATVSSGNEKINGKKVTVIGNKITRCPGCGQKEVGLTEVMSITIISHHRNHKCPYNGEIIKYLPTSRPIEGLGVVQ